LTFFQTLEPNGDSKEFQIISEMILDENIKKFVQEKEEILKKNQKLEKELKTFQKSELKLKKEILTLEERELTNCEILKKQQEEINHLRKDNDEINFMKNELSKEIESKELDNKILKDQDKKKEKKFELLNEAQHKLVNLEREKISLENHLNKKEKDLLEKNQIIHQLNSKVKHFEEMRDGNSEKHREERNYFSKSFDEKSDECRKLNEELRLTEKLLKNSNESLKNEQLLNETLKKSVENFKNRVKNDSKNEEFIKNELKNTSEKVKSLQMEIQFFEKKLKSIEMKEKNWKEQRLSKEILPYIESLQVTIQESFSLTTKSLKRKSME
jgi:hypothetical protein